MIRPWSELNETERLAASLRKGTPYADGAAPEDLARARALLAIDPTPASNDDRGPSRAQRNAQSYTGAGPVDYANLEQFSDRQLQDIREFGANAPTEAERRAISAEASQILASRRPTVRTPQTNGMGMDGRQLGADILAPAVNEPVTENYDFQYVPPTGEFEFNWGPNDGMGGQTPATGGGQPATGGGQPAAPAPMGDVTADWGPNSDFYNNQFNQLLGQSNQFQADQRAAAEQRGQAQQAPQQSFTPDWSWADLPEVRTNAAPAGSGAAEAFSWGINPAYNITPGETTNSQIANMVGPNLNQQQFAWLRQNLQESGTGEGTFWGQAGSPDVITNASPGVHQDWADTLSSLANNIYTRSDLTTPAGGGPAAPPPGYASPR